MNYHCQQSVVRALRRIAREGSLHSDWLSESGCLQQPVCEIAGRKQIHFQPIAWLSNARSTPRSIMFCKFFGSFPGFGAAAR